MLTVTNRLAGWCFDEGRRSLLWPRKPAHLEIGVPFRVKGGAVVARRQKLRDGLEFPRDRAT